MKTSEHDRRLTRLRHATRKMMEDLVEIKGLVATGASGEELRREVVTAVWWTSEQTVGDIESGKAVRA